MRPEISRSAARTTRASVTGSIRAVASSSTTTRTSRTSSRANATSCSSPAESVVPPGPSIVSRPSGSPATHSVRPSSATAASTRARRHVTEERHVLCERAGDHLGALGDDADRGPQLLQVEVAHVGASQQHRAPGRLHRPRQQRGERGLAGPGATDERAGVSRRDDEVDVPERESAGAVAELEVAELHVERAVGQWQTAGRLRRGGQHGAQPQDRAEALLQVGQVTRQHVDAADEHRRDEEEGDEPGGRQVTGEHEGGADDRDGGQRAVQQPAAAPGDPGLDLEDPSSAAWTRAAMPGVAAQHVRLSQRGAQVVAGGDPLLGGCRMVGPAASSMTLRSATCGSSRRTTQYVAKPVSGKRTAAGHQARVATTQSGPEARRVRTACHTPQRISWPTSQVSSSMRSSTSPTACSDSSESGWAIAASTPRPSRACAGAPRRPSRRASARGRSPRPGRWRRAAQASSRRGTPAARSSPRSGASDGGLRGGSMQAGPPAQRQRRFVVPIQVSRPCRASSRFL